MKQAHLEITGMVQGVGFRYFVLRMARGLDLNGWVRNRSDGSVELMLEGEEKDIQTAIKACRVGPSRSRVNQVYVNWVDTGDSFDSFRIIS